ncbi:MAG: Sec-independent protein translocase protein TatB [Pseudolabrys sp.]|nr:Sec-independent protein translocase protein TatB [Pseudolabrys sp.]
MFNFGWGEIVLIGIVALIAIGPKELPTVLRSVGQMVSKLRRMANEFQGQFQEALREAEIADLKKSAEELHSAVKGHVSDLTKIDPLADTRKEIEKAFDEPAGSPTSTAADFSADTAPQGVPVTPVETTEALPPPPEREALPPPAEQADLAKIDVPVPEPLPPPTSEDFLPKTDVAAATPEPAAAPEKKAGGAA